MFHQDDNSDSIDDEFDLLEEKEPKSLDSSFNEDSLKTLVSNRISNKYLYIINISIYNSIIIQIK